MHCFKSDANQSAQHHSQTHLQYLLLTVLTFMTALKIFSSFMSKDRRLGRSLKLLMSLPQSNRVHQLRPSSTVMQQREWIVLTAGPHKEACCRKCGYLPSDALGIKYRLPSGTALSGSAIFLYSHFEKTLLTGRELPAGPLVVIIEQWNVLWDGGELCEGC